MSESLIIKDGLGSVKALQVDSGSNGYISNHTLVSIAKETNVTEYYYGGSNTWNWEEASGTFLAAPLDSSRKGIIITNGGTELDCYVLLNASTDSSNLCGYGSIADLEEAPSKYTFVLGAGGTYFGDAMTCALGHAVYVPSSSLAGNPANMYITVTEIY